jgi:hypothetical protein
MARGMASVIRKRLRPAWVRWIVLPLRIGIAGHAGWPSINKWRFQAERREMRASGEPARSTDEAPHAIGPVT